MNCLIKRCCKKLFRRGAIVFICYGIFFGFFDGELFRVNKASASGYAFVSKWGSSGTGDGQFPATDHVQIANDSSGNVYTSEFANDRIQKFDSSGTFITKWGTPGVCCQYFGGPRGISIDSSDNVFLADYGTNNIKKFDSSGSQITMWGIAGSSNGRFNHPTGVVTDTSGNVYVVDYDNNRVQRFNSSGTYTTKWGSYGVGDGQFNGPDSNPGIDSSGNIYVADTGNSRIQKFDSVGTYITKWGSSGTGNGQFNTPSSVFVDTSDNVYVADANNHRIQVFDVDGNYVAQWGSNGTGNGQFSFPYGVTVDSSGNIYVADAGNHRVQRFIYDSTSPTVSYFNPSDDTTDVDKDATFEIAFNETIATSTGNIYLYRTNDDSLIETVDITGPKVTASSTSALIIDPSATLDYSTGYYITMDATAVTDTVSNSYAGISASTTWSFTVEAAPVQSRSSGTTVQRRIANLIEMGNMPLAEELMKTYPGVPVVQLEATSTDAQSTAQAAQETKCKIANAFTKDMYFGFADDEVKELQKILNCLGFLLADTGAGSLGNETRFFGPYTRKALIAFQKANGIEPYLGYFGPITRGVINIITRKSN